MSARPACIVEEGPADFVVELPNLAGWLNVNDNHGGKLYHGRRHKVLAWREAAAEAARAAGLPRLERARVIGQVCFLDRRRRDPGNWYPTAKAAVDGLVDAGLLDDDSTRYLIGPDMRPGPVVKEHRGLLVLHVYRLPVDRLGVEP